MDQREESAPQTQEAGETGMQPASRLSDRELSEFLLRACHDLRTPVRAIRTSAEMFLHRGESPTGGDGVERLGFILDGAKKIDSLVDGLASYSIALQIEPASFQPTSMGLVLRTVLAKLEKELRDNQAEVTQDQMPRVLGNPDRLIQLIENLIANALRHRGPKAPRIQVGVQETAGAWLFCVQDNGPGVDPAYVERIFQPFARAVGGPRSGAGLGLAVCRLIVERHGGKIWAESTPGQGATFFFTLSAD